MIDTNEENFSEAENISAGEQTETATATAQQADGNAEQAEGEGELKFESLVNPDPLFRSRRGG